MTNPDTGSPDTGSPDTGTADLDLDALLALAVGFAREAGALAMSMREGIETENTKTSPTDVVTAADRAVERLLAERIAAARPDDALLGEEGLAGEGTTGVQWVVDPIDGTVNYLYGQPHWAVSIGVEHAGRAVIGVVLDPSKDEIWTAVFGRGSFLAGRRLACTSVTELSQTMVGTGFGYDARRRAAQAAVLTRVLPAVRDIRRVGAGALDLCMVAAGRVDAYYEQGLAPWDRSAGGLVASEAGAVVAGLRGRPAGPALTVAAGPGIWQAFHDLLVEVDADRDPLA